MSDPNSFPKSSKNKGVECNGVDLRGKKAPNFIDLKYVVWAYENYDPQEKFILGANLKKPFFDLLCGGPTIRKQILSGIRVLSKKITDCPPITESHRIVLFSNPVLLSHPLGLAVGCLLCLAFILFCTC